MTIQSQPGATILMFPARPAVPLPRGGPRPLSSDRDAVQRIPPVCGSGWYHEAALIEADRTRKP